MHRLAAAKEHLDGPLDARLLASNLRDLARVNARLSGSALSWRALRPFLDESSDEDSAQPLRLLDVGTGSADIPRDLIRRARALNRRLEVRATDIQPEIVDYARRAAPVPEELSLAIASAGRIDAEDDAYDVAHSSLVVHHLEPDAAAALLSEMARVARRAVIVNDLDRGRIWLIGARVLSLVATRNPYTRHDAPLSVRRAYTAEEVVKLAAAVGLGFVAGYRAVPPYRYALVFERQMRVE